MLQECSTQFSRVIYCFQIHTPLLKKEPLLKCILVFMYFIYLYFCLLQPHCKNLYAVIASSHLLLLLLPLIQNDWRFEIGAMSGLGGSKPEMFLSPRKGNLTFLIDRCLAHHEKARSCIWGIISEHWQQISLAVLRQNFLLCPFWTFEKGILHAHSFRVQSAGGLAACDFWIIQESNTCLASKIVPSW